MLGCGGALLVFGFGLGFGCFGFVVVVGCIFVFLGGLG